jgi:hypothetical protein
MVLRYRVALAALVLSLLGLVSGPTTHAASPAFTVPVIVASLHPVGGSGVSGTAILQQHTNSTGTHVNLIAFGLVPGSTHVSLVYEDNHVCNLEAYDAGDHIGPNYTANAVGIGITAGDVEADLDEINSVSVRDIPSFKLLACADVHPGR